MFKKMKQATKLKVKDRTVVLTVGAVIIIGVSMVIASLLPSSGLGNFSAKNISGGSCVGPDCGYCVYNYDLLGHVSKKLSTLAECQIEGIIPDMYGSTGSGWYAFCPGMSRADGDAGKCNCSAGISEKSPRLTNGIDRDGKIESLNNGDLLLQNDQDGIDDLIDIGAATSLRCECGVLASDWGGAVLNNGKPVLIPGVNAPLYEFTGVSGQQKLIQEWAKLLTKMTIFQPNDFLSCKNTWPAGCSVTRSYDEGGRSKCKNGSTPLSPHGRGLAIDITCKELVSSSGGCTGTQTADLLKAIKAAGSKFNIIQECSTAQQACNGTSGGNQLIHLDLVGPNDGCPRGGDGTKPCMYTNCDFVCESTTP